MAMAGKGTRSITVDGERYRYRASHSDVGVWESATVVVEAWEGGQRVVARFDPFSLTGSEPEPYFSKRLVRMVKAPGRAGAGACRSDGCRRTASEPLRDQRAESRGCLAEVRSLRVVGRPHGLRGPRDQPSEPGVGRAARGEVVLHPARDVLGRDRA